MTEKQIIQNAEEWVRPLIDAEDGGYSENSLSIALIKNAFIAGAYSRDEEIEDLENGGKDLIKTMTRMQAELDKLRNPWISVKEKRPPIKTRVLFLDYNGKAWFGKNTISGYAELESDKQEILPPPTIPTCKPIITHWMPIPEIKK